MCMLITVCCVEATNPSIASEEYQTSSEIQQLLCSSLSQSHNAALQKLSKPRYLSIFALSRGQTAPRLHQCKLYIQQSFTTKVHSHFNAPVVADYFALSVMGASAAQSCWFEHNHDENSRWYFGSYVKTGCCTNFRSYKDYHGVTLSYVKNLRASIHSDFQGRKAWANICRVLHQAQPKLKRRSKRSKQQQPKGNLYNEQEPEDIDESSSTSSLFDSERETQNSRNRKWRKSNTSCRSLSSPAQAVEGDGEADNHGSFAAAEPTSELGMAQDAARVVTDTRFSSSIHSHINEKSKWRALLRLSTAFAFKCEQMKNMVYQ
ncbi:hypothetical protein BJ742DRAFT_737954 [Cladochytrium replicatum]|nr:hypothetical protein BJ742DRAFT_737954 [Cladochytrium replicatum]